MILGKKDKEKFRILLEENKRLREFEDWHKNLVADTDATLLNILKSVLYMCNNNELIIEQKDIESASKGEIYITDDILRFAKRIKLVFKENKLKEVE